MKLLDELERLAREATPGKREITFAEGFTYGDIFLDENCTRPATLKDLLFFDLLDTNLVLALCKVVRAASKVNRLLNEWDLIRQNCYAHESLRDALAKLESNFPS